MRAFLAVLRREFGAAIDGALAPALAAGGSLALLLGFCIVGFPLGEPRLPGLWAGGVASLAPAFAWLPLWFVLLCPALAMGAWAEERARGTEELLLSSPAPPLALVLGKFAAGLALLWLLLLSALLPLWALCLWLGPLDPGPALGGLLGAFALGGVSLAWCHWLSALCREQLLAFLLGALSLGALWVLGLIAPNLPAGSEPWVWLLAPSAHYGATLARGLFEWRDLFWFAVAGLLPLGWTWASLEARRWR
jgi:ABC-2 type transport system permease protein